MKLQLEQLTSLSESSFAIEPGVDLRPELSKFKKEIRDQLNMIKTAATKDIEILEI